MNTFIICASGPSLNKSDCELISGSGLPVIAVNSTWRAVPDCEYIYAGDLRWWDANIDVLPSSASRWTCNYRARYRLNLFLTQVTVRPSTPGGAASPAAGGEKHHLVRFDCSVAMAVVTGMVIVGLDNPTAECHAMAREFANTPPGAGHGKVNIINSNRQTALKCFWRLGLGGLYAR